MITVKDLLAPFLTLPIEFEIPATKVRIFKTKDGDLAIVIKKIEEIKEVLKENAKTT